MISFVQNEFYQEVLLFIRMQIQFLFADRTEFEY